MGGVESVPTDRSRRVKVISAGFSRTGTVSMSLALAKLVDGPVLHGGTQLFLREDDFCATWAEAYRARNAGDTEKVLECVRRATAGFVATADLPPADFIPEMMQVYPDAKVVLVRRDPRRWWDSIVGVTGHMVPWWVGVLLAPIPGWRYMTTIANEYSQSTLRLAGVTDGNATPRELIEKGGPHILEAHNERVRDAVPKGQLLEMELSEGWGPLCKFLGVPVPDEPFPRANDGQAADAFAKGVFRRAFIFWMGILSGLGAVSYSGILLWKGRFS